ncbi:MAG: nucleotidyltransferase family protein [Methylophilaceae bacterium]|nr:nucleotidyltransferase family protein [Methylophilaceae bacterium]
MKVMILAAGRGERMRPLTDHTPKPLLEVGGKPLIVWHLEALARQDFREVVINHAYLGEQIEQRLGNGAHWGLHIQYSREGVALETAGGIALALPLLGEEPFMVINADVFTHFDFSRLRHVLTPMHYAHLVMVDNPLQHSDGDFAYHQGCLSLEGAPRLTFAGIGVYHPALFDRVVCGAKHKLAGLLRTAISQQQVGATHYQGIWYDIGTPERLAALNQELRNVY